MKTWIIILAVLLFISVVINVILAIKLHFVRKGRNFDRMVTAGMINFDWNSYSFKYLNIMKVLIIIIGLLLIAAIWVIFRQNERSDVQKEFLNLSLQRIKDLEEENVHLKQQVESLGKANQPESTDNDYQGHWSFWCLT